MNCTNKNDIIAWNPVKFIDPDGLEPTPAEAAAMALHVYGDKDSQKANLGNWRVSKRNFGISLNTSNGLKSMVYEKVINGKVTEIFFIKYEFAKFLIVFNRMGFTEQQ